MAWYSLIDSICLFWWWVKPRGTYNSWGLSYSDYVVIPAQIWDQSHPVVRGGKCSAQDHQQLDSRSRAGKCPLTQGWCVATTGAAPSPGFLTPVPWAAPAGRSDFSSQLQVSPTSASCAEQEWVPHCWSGTSPRAETVQLLSSQCVMGGREGDEVPDSWLNQGPTISVLCSEMGFGGPGPLPFAWTPDLLTFRILRSISWGNLWFRDNLCTLCIKPS